MSDNLNVYPAEIKKKSDMCRGCYNDDYNHGLGGASKCWLLDDAKMVMKKKVSIDDMPPWKHEPIKVFDCRTELKFVFIKPDREK